MRTSRVFFLVVLLAEVLMSLAQAQESAFELPVQLIGFPVIIIAVRLSNFVKKLAYSLNPRTYSARSRRSTDGGVDPAMDVVEVEKKLIREFGAHVCIFEKVCEHYAELTQNNHGSNHILDWETIFGEYKSSPSASKQNYLLSVFLGDIVASPGLCHALAKKGRGCHGEPHHRDVAHVHRIVARKGNLAQPDRENEEGLGHSNHTAVPGASSHKNSSGHHHDHQSSITHRRGSQHRKPARTSHAAHSSTSHNTHNEPNHAATHERLLLDHPAQVPRRHLPS